MRKLSIPALRQKLCQVAEKAGKPRLASLKRRKLIKGDAVDLAEMKVGEWREPNNLG